MDVAELIQSKENENYLKDLSSSIQENKDGLLSESNVQLGLIILDKIPALSDRSDCLTHYYRSTIDQGTKRYNAILEISSSEDLWEDDDRFKLLEFIFGTRIAPLVREAWKMIPTLMYQTGYGRRSFRSSDAKELYFVNQLSFIITLISQNDYDFSLEEYVQYSNNIYDTHFAYLYAAAINMNDSSITNLLLDTVYGRHEKCRPSYAIIKGLLLSDNKECWIAIEKLLISAQRQEGLRQTILECLDETNLGAMKHIIKVIIDNKLSRFAAVIRAVDTWAGFGWEVEKETTVRRFLEFADQFLTDPSLIEKAVKSKDNAEVYMALWAQGVLDVEQCYPLIDEVIKGGNEKVTLALYFVEQVRLPTFSLKYGNTFIDDSNPVVLCQASNLINNNKFIKLMSKDEKAELFTKLESKLEHLPAKKELSKPLVFSWLIFKYDKETVYDLMINLLDFTVEHDIDKILPHFETLTIGHREFVTSSILDKYSRYNYRNKESKTPPTTKQRDFAFSILKDRSESIKVTAINALTEAELGQEEIKVFEGLLSRKSADFRKLAINLLLKQDKEIIKGSTERLIEAKNVEQRLAGLDLLLWIKSNTEESSWVQAKVSAYKERKSISSKEETVLLGLGANAEQSDYTLEKGYGLFSRENLPTTEPFDSTCSTEFTTELAQNNFLLSQPVDKINESLLTLQKTLKENENHEYTVEDWDGRNTTILLGNQFRTIKRNIKEMTVVEQFENYPLYEKWEAWTKETKLTTKDLFLMQLGARIGFDEDEDDEAEKTGFAEFNKALFEFIFVAKIPEIGKYEWQNPIFAILDILELRFPFEDKIQCLEDLVRNAFSKVDDSILHLSNKVPQRWGEDTFVTWRDQSIITTLWSKYSSMKKEMNQEQFARYWQLAQWHFLTAPEENDVRVSGTNELYDYARAYNDKLINKDLLYWRAMMPGAINELTNNPKKGNYNIKEEFPFLNEVIEICRDRILDIELIRGDSSTSVTRMAQNLNKLYSINNFVMLLKAMGKDTLHRGYIYSWGDQEYNKKEILSTLLKRCFPAKEDDQKQFDKAVKEAGITDKRLCDACTYSPQWLPFVASYLGWKEMESAVWWLHAHTNGYHDNQTESEIAKYSAVELSDFQDGAVDYNWFKDVYKVLKKARWDVLTDAAKYISDGGGHKRGLLYADVILGKTKIKEITERVVSKRNQDYLRVYGVIPLSKTNPQKDVLKRYQFLQKFKKESKQFGSQRQASESTAVKVAMENLARTAGYPDPIRLQWAMETKEAQEIVANAGILILGDTQISLEIDDQGKSSIKTVKDGKELKSIPAKYKKDKGLEQLKAYNKTLREQHKRTKKSLENAMINGDLFTKEEIETLGTHPVVAPMLQKVVLLSDGKCGFFKDNALTTLSNETLPLSDDIRIAHCVDLYESKEWSDYQHYCFANELKQPFKQVFRELYVPTADELKEKTVSRRYAGHQVQPKKTVALLKGQAWTVDYDEGLQKVNHKQNIIARMFAMADWFSPADVESPTLETIEFFDRKKGDKIPFEKVDKRVFSETMRDIDLVVSVAHVGEVDPEASQSSIELRTVIVKETCQLFKLDNVSFSENHVKIKGDLGNYSVHLGSGVCHKVASASLSIIPVHSQHRGKLFLPFVDEDPKTAEIISKVLLLAKDKEIQDPTILSQM